jgi:hypothetical protein
VPQRRFCSSSVICSGFMYGWASANAATAVGVARRRDPCPVDELDREAGIVQAGVLGGGGNPSLSLCVAVVFEGDELMGRVRAQSGTRWSRSGSSTGARSATA